MAYLTSHSLLDVMAVETDATLEVGREAWALGSASASCILVFVKLCAQPNSWDTGLQYKTHGGGLTVSLVLKGCTNPLYVGGLFRL